MLCAPKLLALNFRANFRTTPTVLSSPSCRIIDRLTLFLPNLVCARKNLTERAYFGQLLMNSALRTGSNDERSHRHMSVTPKTPTYAMRATCHPLECFNLPCFRCFRVKPLHTTLFRTKPIPPPLPALHLPTLADFAKKFMHGIFGLSVCHIIHEHSRRTARVAFSSETFNHF